jgi:hypothetical protein
MNIMNLNKPQGNKDGIDLFYHNICTNMCKMKVESPFQTLKKNDSKIEDSYEWPNIQMWGKIVTKLDQYSKWQTSNQYESIKW